MKKVFTDKAPKAIGPYSQAVVYNGICFTSGQIPLDPETGKIVEGGIREQTVRVLQNLEAVLLAAGTNLENSIKTTCYLADIKDFDVFNEEYAKFIRNAPARSCFAVKELPKGALLEVEVMAKV